MTRWLSIIAIVLSLAMGMYVFTKRNPDAGKAGADETAQEHETAGADTPRGGGEGSAAPSRLASFENQLPALSRRVAAIEKAQQTGRLSVVAAPGDDVHRQVERIKGDVDSLLTGQALETEEGRKRFKDVLRTMQDELLAERWQEREEQERQDKFKRFAAEVKLPPEQEQGLRQLLDDENQRKKTVLEQIRSGQGDGLTGRSAVRSLREGTDEAAKAMLTPDQYHRYMWMRQYERIDYGAKPFGGTPPAGQSR